jgi:hypothetical protein
MVLSITVSPSIKSDIHHIRTMSSFVNWSMINLYAVTSAGKSKFVYPCHNGQHFCMFANFILLSLIISFSVAGLKISYHLVLSLKKLLTKLSCAIHENDHTHTHITIPYKNDCLYQIHLQLRHLFFTLKSYHWPRISFLAWRWRQYAPTSENLFINTQYENPKVHITGYGSP